MSDDLREVDPTIDLLWSQFGRLAVRLYGNGIDGSQAARGLKLGLVAWLVGQAPLYLLWYAEQPWPDSLIVKQLGLELLASLAIGLTIAFVSRLPATHAAPRMATV